MHTPPLFGTLAVSAALGSSLALAAMPAVHAQVVECRSWRTATAPCGELFFNKTPNEEPLAPGTANLVRPPLIPNHSTAVVIGNQGQSPTQSAGHDADNAVATTSGASTAPGVLPSAAVTIGSPAQAPNVALPGRQAAGGLQQPLPDGATGAGAATGRGLAGSGIAAPANNVNTPIYGVTPQGVGTVGSSISNPAATTARPPTSITSTSSARGGAAPTPAQITTGEGVSGGQPNPANSNTVTTGSAPACGDPGVNPVTATDSTQANGPAAQPSASAATTGTNAAPQTMTNTSSGTTGSSPSTTVGGASGTAANMPTGCDSPQVQPPATSGEPR